MVGAVAEVVGGVALVLAFCQLRVKLIQVFFDGRVVVHMDSGNVVVSVVGVNQPKLGPVGLVSFDVSPAQHELDDCSGLGVFLYQSFFGGVVNNEGFVESSFDSKVDFDIPLFEGVPIVCILFIMACSVGRGCSTACRLVE